MCLHFVLLQRSYTDIFVYIQLLRLHLSISNLSNLECVLSAFVDIAHLDASLIRGWRLFEGGALSDNYGKYLLRLVMKDLMKGYCFYCYPIP